MKNITWLKAFSGDLRKFSPPRGNKWLSLATKRIKLICLDKRDNFFSLSCSNTEMLGMSERSEVRRGFCSLLTEIYSVSLWYSWVSVCVSIVKWKPSEDIYLSDLPYLFTVLVRRVKLETQNKEGICVLVFVVVSYSRRITTDIDALRPVKAREKKR